MEGFDLSRSLHNAFAPVDNDAYKWQRIYDTRLAWQMENEKTKNELKKLRISDASKLLTGLGNLDYNIMPGPDQEYVQSVLAPLKDAVNEIHGGLMSGQDSEYYLEEAGKIFTIANNILNNDPRLKQSIAVSKVLQSDIANKLKELGNKDKYDIDAQTQFQTTINELSHKHSKGEIPLDKFLAEVRGFDTRNLYSLKHITEKAKNIKKNSITTQNDPLVGKGFQVVKENIDQDNVFSLLREGIELIGGKLDDVVRFVDKDGNPITISQYNAIKDKTEKDKYKLSYITNSIHCGDNKKCAKVIQAIIPVLPGYKIEQTYNDLGKSEISVQAELRKKAYENAATLDKEEYNKLVAMALENIKGINERLKGAIPPEEAAKLEGEKKFWNDYIQNLRKPTTEVIVTDQDTTSTPDAKETAFGVKDTDSDNPMDQIMSYGLNKTINQTINQNDTKDTIETAIINMFKYLYNDKHKYIGTKDKDGNIVIDKEFNDTIHNLINEFLTPDKLKLYKEKNYSYKAIFDDLFKNIEQGSLRGLHNAVHNFFNIFGINNDTVKSHLHENILSKLIKDKVGDLTNIFEKEGIKIVQQSRFNEANPKAQRDITDFVKRLDNTIISEKDGDRVDVSKIQNVEGIDYIGDKMYLRAHILDKDNKLKQVKLSIDSNSEQTVFDQVRDKIIAADANNPVLSVRDPNYDRANALINTNYKTFKGISYTNNFVNNLQSINKLSDNKRKQLLLIDQDNRTTKKNSNVTIEYTKGSMPVEITYSVDEKNNTINDLVQLRYFRYKQDGSKQYLQDRPYYIHISGNKDNFDEILSYTHSSIKDMEQLQRKEYEEYLKKEQEKKKANKSNSQ